MSFDVHVRNTGTVRQVSGLSTTEAIMTMMMNATDQNSKQTGTMAITNDMWLVPEIPGYAQVRDFYMRMAAKMGTMPAATGMDFSRMLAQNPGATQGLAEMAKEMQKIQGVPVMQVMRMGTTTDGKPLPAASEAPLPPDNSPAMPSGGDIAKQSLASALHQPSSLRRLRQKETGRPAAAQTRLEDASAHQRRPYGVADHFIKLLFRPNRLIALRGPGRLQANPISNGQTVVCRKTKIATMF